MSPYRQATARRRAGWRRVAIWTVVAALFVGSAAGVSAQSVQSAPASEAASLQVRDALRAVTEFDVNGLKVLVKRRAGSQTVAAGLFLRGGVQHMTADDAGLEALMLDLETEASVHYPREQFRRELARTGTVIGSGVNRDYSALTLRSTRRYFDRAWAMFTDVVLHPSFSPDDFQRVKEQELVGLSDDEDTPDSFLQLLEARVIYAGHPYAVNPHGTTESVKGLTLDGLKRYHTEMMQTSRLLLVVVGDIDPQTLRAKVASSFGTLPRGDYHPVTPPALSFSAPTVTITARDLPTNYVQGVFAAPAMTSPDFYPMQVAISLLRERVFTEVRVKRSLSYAPDAFLSRQAANVGGIYFTAVDASQTAQVMLNEVARLQQVLVDQDELTGVAQQFLTTYYMGQETNNAQAGELAQYELIGGGWRNAGDFLDRLRSVTPDDVRRVARTYMRNLQFVVLGNPQSIDNPIFTGQATGR